MSTSRRCQLLLTAGAVALLGASLAGPAAAQSTAAGNPQAPAEATTTVETITVTGSRIAKAGFEAPTPTTVVGAEVLEASPQPNIAANLNQLPTLSGSTSPRTAGNVVGGGAQGANFLNLRSLGPNRTLVLLDRRRVVAAATTGSVDIGLLPTALIKQVDIVTGGASAAWGSDAVAGVVNLVIDDRFTGLKGSVQKGVSTYGDGAESRAELAGGTAFAGGRGHLVASAAYSKSASIDRVDSRPWFVGAKLINNPAYAAGNGQPKLVIADNVNSSTGTFGGLITAGPLRGTQFVSGSFPTAFNFGTVGTNVSVVNGAYGGSQLGVGGQANDLARLNQIIADVEQYNLFAHATYELTDKVKVYGEATLGRSIAASLSVPYLTMAPNGTPITVQRDNAFLPASTVAAMTAAGVTNFQLNRYNLDLGFASPHNDRRLERYMVGVDVELVHGWKGEAYYEHGVSKVQNAVHNDGIVSTFALAADAVRAPSGAIVCRSTLTNPSNGCIPFNVLGPQTPTAAQRAYLLGTAVQHITLKEDVAAVNLNGDLFTLPAGTVTLAIGAEYRKEDHVADADPNSLLNRTGDGPGTGNWWVGNYKPSTGGYNVKEAYGELLVPILKDSPLGQQLNFNGAARVTDYSTSGTVVAWKAGATYDIAGGFKLRGVLSRDIRAPNLNEYFLGGTANSVSVVDGINGAVGALRIQSGNANLDPEIAKTATFGAVFQPRFLPGFSLSADYFHIKLDGAIGTLTPQQTVDRCNAGNKDLCVFLIRNAAGQLTTILSQPVNFRTELMKGVDVESSYRFDLGPGRVTLRSLWTYTPTHYLLDQGVRDSLTGEVAQAGGGPVKLRAFNAIAFDTERLNVSLRHRYIGKAVLDAAWTSADIADSSVRAVNYVDLSATAKMQAGGRKVEVFGSVDNVFNALPPRAPQTGGNPNTNIGTAAAFYDLVGRYFRVGFRFSL